MFFFFVEVGLEADLLHSDFMFVFSRFESGSPVDDQVGDFVEGAAALFGVGDADVDIDVPLRLVLPPALARHLFGFLAVASVTGSLLELERVHFEGLRLQLVLVELFELGRLLRVG